MNEDSSSESPHSPYPGLRPFRWQESILLTGRDALVKAGLDKLKENRFLAVLGPVGCGKTSLVEAGLVPHVHGGKLTSDAPGKPKVVHIRPGKGNPLRMLAAELVAISNDDPEEYAVSSDCCALRNDLMAPGTLERYLEGIEKLKRFNLVLFVVDPFESLFFLTESNAEADDVKVFIHRLLDLANLGTNIKAYVVIGIRVEFLEPCCQVERLADAISQSLVLVPRLSREQCVDAVKRAAERFRAGIHDDLGALLERHLESTGCNLPLLQHAMMRTWAGWQEKNGAGFQPSRRRKITKKYYKGLNGLARSLSECADEALKELGQAGSEIDRGRYERIAKRLFQALGRQVKFSVETKIPIRLGGLWESLLSKFEGEPGFDQKVLEQGFLNLMNKFREPGVGLISPSLDELERRFTVADLKSDEIVELGHTCLIRHWGRLESWVAEPPDQDKVFFSYNTPERKEVLRIWHDVAREGIQPWIDVYALLAGDLIVASIREAIAHAQTIVVFWGQDGMGMYQDFEVEIAIKKAIKQPHRRVIPVILPSFEGSPDDLPDSLSVRVCVDFRNEPAAAHRRLVEAIVGSREIKRG
jgi:energy-coupling factor transporter ATP-binding protein EcfA2